MKQIIEWVRRFANWLTYTGLWIPIPLTACVVYTISFLNPYYFMSIQLILFLFLLSHVIPTYIWSLNRIAKSNGLEKFDLFPVNIATNPMYQVSYRMQAMRRKPPEDLLYDTPRGLVLGTYASKYVCVIPGEKGASHLLVVGGSGSGKTSSVLACTELATKMNKKNTSLPFTSIMIDVKGELEEKFFSPCDGRLVVFNPRDRSRWGFDFLYDINEDSTEADVLSAMRRIVYNLVPMQQNSTGERFWVDGPRNILLGLFLYGWKYQKCRTLPDLADFALSKNLKALINEVLLDVDEFSVISKFLTPFGGEEAADETISSLAMNVGNALQLIATDETLRYLLRECDRKISPTLVEQGISIDLQISDAYLDTYAQIMRLAISTCCTSMMMRPEGSSPILLIVDEAGRIAHEGQIEGLQQVLQIGRSRGVSVILCLQSWSAMEAVYTVGDCKDMLNNLQYRLVLQSSPDAKDTTEMCMKAFGKYQEKKRSVTNGHNKSVSYSFEEKDILQETDLLSLPEKKKAILLSPYGAFMLDKCQYFSDPILKKIANKIKEDRKQLKT